MVQAEEQQRTRPSVEVAPERYSRWFLGSEQAQEYESGVYAEGSYDSWIWRQQQDYLETVLERHLTSGRIRYLDFACGSGRVTSFFEPRVAESTGIDVSPAMLELAAGNLTRSRLVCADAIADRDVLEGRFDLVTAFRFFLNADEELRHQALEAIHDVLADGGVFVFNIHGNKASMRFFGAEFRRRVLGTTTINQLSFRQVRRLLRQHGFGIAEFRGFGLLVPRAHKLLGPGVSRPMERLVARFPILNYFCVDLVFVCRRVRASQVIRVQARRSAASGPCSSHAGVPARPGARGSAL